MTKNSFDKFRDVGSPLSEWTIPAEDGVHRRTIVKGAAWTIPVVAVAVATPAAAASKTPTLKFTQGSYTGTACQTITGVQVKRTTDGTTPDPGQTVTVTLKDGYTFADGSTTYSGTTDANGLITLPNIKVPAKGGDTTFNATSGTLTASAPVKTPVGTFKVTRINVTTAKAKDGPEDVAANSKSVGNTLTLAPNGDLHQMGVKDAIATGVTSAIGDLDSKNNTTYVTYVVGTELYRRNLTTKAVEGPTTVPTDSIAVGNTVALAPNGDLYQLGTKDAIVTGVDSALASIDSTNNTTYVTYVVGTNLYRRNLTSGKVEGPTTVPSGTKVVGNVVALAPNGDLYQLGTKDAILTGVDSALASVDSKDNTTYLTYIIGTKLYRRNLTSGKVDTALTVPTGSKVVGNTLALAPNGDLYKMSQTTAIATGVTSATADIDSTDNTTYSTYVSSNC